VNGDLVRHAALLSERPDTWRCVICRGPERRKDGASCERCNGWLHWSCYWPAMLTEAERAAFAAAQEADALAEMLAETADVEVTIRGRKYTVPSFMVGPSVVEDYLNRQIILCPGCRS
jgi:hypothetical protein